MALNRPLRHSGVYEPYVGQTHFEPQNERSVFQALCHQVNQRRLHYGNYEILTQNLVDHDKIGHRKDNRAWRVRILALLYRLQNGGSMVGCN